MLITVALVLTLPQGEAGLTGCVGETFGKPVPLMRCPGGCGRSVFVLSFAVWSCKRTGLWEGSLAPRGRIRA